MSKTQTPSWMASAPSRPGEASQGKFTADQWRTFCTVHLPITLIRLWGSLPSTDRKRQMLVNFMHLVTAVRLGTMRVMTEERIQLFESHIRAYLEEMIGFGQSDRLGGLYPHTSITPYQHMMLHFGTLLRRFGPVHSWRCFAFERFNYILQSTPTNQRFGELEQTMFVRFCQMQKLKAKFHDEGQSSLVHSLATLYQNTFEDMDSRGSRISDALAFEEDQSELADDIASWPSGFVQRLDREMYALLQHCKPADDGSFLSVVQPHQKVKQRGAIFAPQHRSFANAQVILETQGWTAGSIQQIFTAVWKAHDGKHHGKTFASIKLYKPLNGNDLEHDHYHEFGFSGGRLFYDELESHAVLIPLDNIISHFGHTSQLPFATCAPVVHVLPLNKDSEI
ncbi:hypothetical protein EV361DRAFT_120089 [Lentinula raphanica]|nr:hypothetical protein EV361DRAFT_120089 [Lentinula raphanica]